MMSSPTIFNPHYERVLKLAMSIVLLSICTCGVCGNAIVLAVGLLKRRSQKNVTNCYIMNLAVTDLLFLLISVPLTAYLGVQKTWIFGEFTCKMHIYLAHVLLQATCYTLAAMSIDRYLCIVHDVWYRRFRKPRYGQGVCLFIWLVTIMFMFPYEHFLNTNKAKTNETSYGRDCIVHDSTSSFSSCIFPFIFYYILPLTVIGLCYLRVVLHVRRTGYQIVKRLSGIPRQSIQLKQRRVQRMVLWLTLAFALCWLPIHILEILNCSQLLSQQFYVEHFYALETSRMTAHAFSYFNSCLNPFLYALLNKRFFF